MFVVDPYFDSKSCMSNLFQMSTHPKTATDLPGFPFAEPSSFHSVNLEMRPECGALAARSIGVRLDLEDLPCFTRVNRQYESWGVLFDNAVAICPSNPAYTPYSGVMVLLGAPQSGWIEASFVRPVQYVSGLITSSRHTVMRAFNSSDQLVAQADTLHAEALQTGILHKGILQAGSAMTSSAGAFRAANFKLSLSAANIHRVTLHTFNGHLTLDDFCFSAS